MLASDDEVGGGGGGGGAAGGGATCSRKPVGTDISSVWCPSFPTEPRRGVDSCMSTHRCRRSSKIERGGGPTTNTTDVILGGAVSSDKLRRYVRSTPTIFFRMSLEAH